MLLKGDSKGSVAEGTFEYIEAKIRRDAEGTAFGGDFEWLCKWFLENAPRYRCQFDKVWLWKDWPERWGADAGIDIVARTRTGELWAIQSKADHPDRAIPKREIDSFLSESSRPEFAYRLLMATTDDIGATARRTLHAQEKPVGLVLRGHLLTEELEWPVQIRGTAAPLARWNPRPHQATAIQAVVNGFEDHDRGRLIMACGTGKTLTALWILAMREFYNFVGGVKLPPVPPKSALHDGKSLTVALGAIATSTARMEMSS